MYRIKLRNIFRYLQFVFLLHANRVCPACEKHFHGEKCDRVCSFLCQDQHCHPETGYCYECPPGRIGHDCKQVCGKGFYGHQCKLACSDGCDSRGCHYDNGLCFGCKSGKTGFLCEDDCKKPRVWGLDCVFTCPEECKKPPHWTSYLDSFH